MGFCFTISRICLTLGDKEDEFRSNKIIKTKLFSKTFFKDGNIYELTGDGSVQTVYFPRKNKREMSGISLYIVTPVIQNVFPNHELKYKTPNTKLTFKGFILNVFFLLIHSPLTETFHLYNYSNVLFFINVSANIFEYSQLSVKPFRSNSISFVTMFSCWRHKLSYKLNELLQIQEFFLAKVSAAMWVTNWIWN